MFACSHPVTIPPLPLWICLQAHRPEFSGGHNSARLYGGTARVMSVQQGYMAVLHGYIEE